MDKRTFLKQSSLAALSLLAGSSLAAQPTLQKNTLPANWMWLRPNLKWSDDEWKKQLDKIRAAGIEAILPEVYNSTHALFDHPSFPVKERFLERLLPLAKAADLQVHAWMWTMPLCNPTYKKDHPDWYAVNRKGESAHDQPAYVGYYNFMCPCHPEVPAFVQRNVEALARIEDLDGVHLDYVRLPDAILAKALQPKYGIVQDKEYPEYDYCYSTFCREQFKEQSGIDPMDIENPQEHKAWNQFRYDAISNIVNNFAVPTAHKYGKKITAAVFPNWQSVRQQWHRWNLDAFLPMLYHNFYDENPRWIKEQVEAALGRMEEARPVYSGLYMPALPTADELALAIDLAKAGGAKGISLFDFPAIKDVHWKVLASKLKS